MCPDLSAAAATEHCLRPRRPTGPQIFAVVAPLVPIGIAFGWLAANRGLTAIEVLLLSLFGFSGSGQFTWLQMTSSGTPMLVLFAVLLATNLRYVPMAMTAASGGHGSSLRSAFSAHLLSDESYVLEGDGLEKSNRLLLRATVASVWILATVLGTVLPCGSTSHQSQISTTAMFAASAVISLLAMGRLRSSGRRPGSSTLGHWVVFWIALSAVFLLGRWFWIPSLVVGLFVLSRSRSKESS